MYLYCYKNKLTTKESTVLEFEALYVHTIVKII